MIQIFGIPVDREVSRFDPCFKVKAPPVSPLKALANEKTLVQRLFPPAEFCADFVALLCRLRYLYVTSDPQSRKPKIEFVRQKKIQGTLGGKL
jgi:hypothetical protein